MDKDKQVEVYDTLMYKLTSDVFGKVAELEKLRAEELQRIARLQKRAYRELDKEE